MFGIKSKYIENRYWGCFLTLFSGLAYAIKNVITRGMGNRISVLLYNLYFYVFMGIYCEIVMSSGIELQK